MIKHGEVRLSKDFINTELISDISDINSVYLAVKDFLPRELRIRLLTTNQSRKQAVLDDEILSYLSKIAPEGCYFGPYPEDNNNLGFWEIVSDDI